jgi:hypothetical protein
VNLFSDILDRIIALEEEEEAIARPVVPKSLPPLVAGKRPLRIAQIAPLAESVRQTNNKQNNFTK